MHIVADENMPAVAELCGDLGTIELVDGRRLTLNQLRDADILLVRSVTPVNASLLQHTRVRYVGTATAGTDHIDIDYLTAHGIHFASAPGCNATAVAEYVTSCVLTHCLITARNTSALTVGVIGCGHAGTAVIKMLSSLGITCVLNDPPRAAREGVANFCSLQQALMADVVSLHVPLIRSGEWRTEQLIGPAEIAGLAANALVINAARGGVLDEDAWLLGANPAQSLILDCWVGEPKINLTLLDRCWIATPHIAGHTVDARRRATQMLAADLRAFLGFPVVADEVPRLDVPEVLKPRVTPGQSLPTVLSIITQACDPVATTQTTRRLREVEVAAASGCFDEQRRQCGRRREFSAYRVKMNELDSPLQQTVAALGFNAAE
ncbi:MAG: erythronate-4-phosphate dehydrogenase [Gammaproteobacteria bacterium]|nr:erythronate-4-phosphate dehydrogenase [Gammaproteobacteria bacterium]